MKFKPGQQAFVLCAKVDPFGVDDDLWERSEPAIEASSFSWLQVTVIGPGESDDTFEVRLEDGATTEYETRFLLTDEEAMGIALPVPKALEVAYELASETIAVIDKAVAEGRIPTIGIDAPNPDAPDYDITVLDHGFEPGTYGGWTVQFQVAGLPRLSYQTQDPILEAFIPLERAPDTAPRLSAGGGSALARTDESGSALAETMLGGTAEHNILRGFAGAAVVESAPKTVGNAPVELPSDERIAEACRRPIREHLAAVAAEKARLSVTEGGEAVVGKKLKVRG